MRLSPDIAPLHSMDIPKTRKSYTREDKIGIIEFYHSCKNQSKTCKAFGVDTKTLTRMIRNEDKIRSSPVGTKKMGSGRTEFYPEMEKRLVSDYTELREKGIKVRYIWFKTRAIGLCNELYPGNKFQFSSMWFQRFKKRNGIVLPTKTTLQSTKTRTCSSNVLSEIVPHDGREMTTEVNAVEPKLSGPMNGIVPHDVLQTEEPKHVREDEELGKQYRFETAQSLQDNGGTDIFIKEEPGTNNECIFDETCAARYSRDEADSCTEPSSAKRVKSSPTFSIPDAFQSQSESSYLATSDLKLPDRTDQLNTPHTKCNSTSPAVEHWRQRVNSPAVQAHSLGPASTPSRAHFSNPSGTRLDSKCPEFSVQTVPGTSPDETSLFGRNCLSCSCKLNGTSPACLSPSTACMSPSAAHYHSKLLEMAEVEHKKKIEIMNKEHEEKLEILTLEKEILLLRKTKLIKELNT